MTGGTWHSLRCTSRFDGLGLVGPVRTTYARGPVTRRAAAPAPAAPPAPRPRKPAPVVSKPATVRASLADGFGCDPDGSHGLSGSGLGQRAVGPVSRRDLRRELESLRGKAGPLAAQRRAMLKRKLALLEAAR